MHTRWSLCATVVTMLLCFPPSGQAQADAAFPLTVQALQERYADEVAAHARYGAYADRACSEGYPNIAHLFRALAASEAVHARNFRRLLQELHAPPRAASEPVVPAVSDTRYNLKHAAEVERDEIDNEYPGILERIEGERHDDAITNITYAWKAEQQHRDLIVKLQRSAIRWFGMVVKRIEGEPSHFYVCGICGSTLRETPPGACPICNHASDRYTEIDPPAEDTCETDGNPADRLD